MTLTVYPYPGPAQAGLYINMRVARMPLTCYDKADQNRRSEIPESYVLDVLEWAAYRAQRTFDADAGAPTSADAHKKAFDEAVTNAIEEAKRKMFGYMGYKYGRNGFAWVR